MTRMSSCEFKFRQLARRALTRAMRSARNAVLNARQGDGARARTAVENMERHLAEAARHVRAIAGPRTKPAQRELPGFGRRGDA